MAKKQTEQTINGHIATEIKNYFREKFEAEKSGTRAINMFNKKDPEKHELMKRYENEYTGPFNEIRLRQKAQVLEGKTRITEKANVIKRPGVLGELDSAKELLISDLKHIGYDGKFVVGNMFVILKDMINEGRSYADAVVVEGRKAGAALKGLRHIKNHYEDLYHAMFDYAEKEVEALQAVGVAAKNQAGPGR